MGAGQSLTGRTGLGSSHRLPPCRHRLGLSPAWQAAGATPLWASGFVSTSPASYLAPVFSHWFHIHPPTSPEGLFSGEGLRLRHPSPCCQLRGGLRCYPPPCPNTYPLFLTASSPPRCSLCHRSPFFSQCPHLALGLVSLVPRASGQSFWWCQRKGPLPREQCPLPPEASALSLPGSPGPMQRPPFLPLPSPPSCHLYPLFSILYPKGVTSRALCWALRQFSVYS